MDDEVRDRAKLLVGTRHEVFRRVVNEASRVVEKRAQIRLYQTKPDKLGLKVGRNLDNIQELISQIEGEEHR